MNLPAGVQQVWDQLAELGPTYLVGGAVRDLWLGRPPRDFDLAVAATPQQIRARFGWPEGRGARFGAMRVPGLPLEVVCMRREAGYADRRRPDQVSFDASLLDDLKRRDFTANAMAMDRGGHWIDPCGGRRDLAAGVLRTVGPADERFAEDALRVMRLYRLAAELGLRPHRSARRAAAAARALLPGVAVERTGQEFWRLLYAPGAVIAMRMARSDGVLAEVAPWLAPRDDPGTRLARVVAWSDAQPDRVDAELRNWAWPRAARRAVVGAVLLAQRVQATDDHAAWRAALQRAGAEQAALLLRAGGGAKLQAFARLFGREGVWNRERLPLRGRALAQRLQLPAALTGRAERRWLEIIWRDPEAQPAMDDALAVLAQAIS